MRPVGRQADRDTHLTPSLSARRHLLSLDGRDERDLWADKLNETLANIRAWDPDALQPQLEAN